MASPSRPMPLRFAEPRAQSTIDARERRIVNVLSFTILFTVVTQKFALPGTNNVEFPFFMVMGVSIWLVLARHATVSRNELAFYLGMSALMILWQILNPLQPNQTFKAVNYLIVMYMPFLLRVAVSREAYMLLLKRFQLVCMLIASMVLLGWATQLAGLGMPNAELFMPKAWLFTNYNYIQPIHWGSPFTKPNGFFMLETSHTSQLLAMGTLIELCVLRRMPILLFLGATLLSTFGGTGLLMILMAAPMVLFYLRPKVIFAGIVAAPLLYLMAMQIGLTDNVANRTGEITGEKQGTSGYGRFITPWHVAGGVIDRGAAQAFFGMGAGNLPSVGGHEVYVINPVPKMIAEYGMILGVVWCLWFHITLFRRGAPAIVTLAALLQYDFMNGSLLIPLNVYYCLLLSSYLVIPPTQKAPEPARPSRWPKLTFPGPRRRLQPAE